MNIIYLTWGETPRSYGVYMSQVVNQLVAIQKEMPKDQFHLISGLPIIHSGLLREKLVYYKEIEKIKNALGGVTFTKIPIYSTQNFVNSNKYTFNLLHGISHRKLYLSIKKVNPEIVHCRSYHATWAALIIRDKFKLNYKVIFDGRDLWPEEMALKKSYNPSTPSYLFLKNIEQQIIIKSNASVSVSEAMHDHYIKAGSINDHCIHISTDTKLLSSQAATYSNNKAINFCYIGALSENTWHKPDNLALLFKKIKTIYSNAKLTIITTSNHNEIRNVFIHHKINDFSLIQTKSMAQLADILADQQFGILSYFTPENNLQIKLGSILLSIKAVEYLSAGLPIICNKFCGGIAKIIEEHDIGINYDPNTYAEINQENILRLLNKEKKERAIALAEQLFDYKENAKRYVKLYQQLTNDE